MKLAQLLHTWRADELRSYARLLGGAPGATRKAEWIHFICRTLLDEASLSAFWKQMDEISRRAVSVAYHNGGEFNRAAFVAQYGSMPPRPKGDTYWSGHYGEPILFDLFVIGDQVADDLMPLLAGLVLPPERYQVKGQTETPSVLGFGERSADVTAVETELTGRNDLLAYLRLLDQKELRFGASNGRFSAASVRKVLDHLMEGDFRDAPEKVSGRSTIRPSGLDVFAQESGLARRSGELTKSGRDYLRSQDPEILLDAFERWTNSGAFDELHRITQLGGLNSRQTRLTTPASRREKVIEALSWCPPGEWIRMDDFYRGVLVWHFDFDVEETRYSNLYVGSRYYGDLNPSDYWLVVKGLYINVVIWEFLATIGALDIAFLVNDFYSLIDTGSLAVEGPFSLYDGLTHFRINALGAYLLGQAGEYAPLQPKHKELFTVDADRRMRLLAALTPNERLQVEAIAEPLDDGSYQLDQTKILSLAEGGASIDHLFEFVRGASGEKCRRRSTSGWRDCSPTRTHSSSALKP